MPIDLKITNHDIERVNGKIVVTSGIEEKRQSLTNRLSTRMGEFFIDTGYGFDYNIIFQDKTVTADEIALYARECLFQDDKVAEVETMAKKEKRAVYVEFNAILITGETIQGGVEIG